MHKLNINYALIALIACIGLSFTPIKKGKSTTKLVNKPQLLTKKIADPKNLHETNPLVAKWDGAFNGTPPFDKVKIADFKPAFDLAMAENEAEVNKIAESKDAPNFVKKPANF